MTREVVLDSETTGRFTQGHRMVSLGVVELRHGQLTGRDYEWFFNPGMACDPGAYAVHGLSDGFLRQQPPFSVQRGEIAEWIGDAKIIAHNAAFDRAFLNQEFALTCGLQKPTGEDVEPYPVWRWKDSLREARRLFPGQKNSLDALAHRYGISVAHRVKHGALKDARILSEVVIELRRGAQFALFDKMPEQPKKPLPTFEGPWPGNRPRLTSAEADRHREVWGDLRATGIWADYLGDSDGEASA